MKHNLDELLNIVFHYYPRNMAVCGPDYYATTEYRRLVDARKQAGTPNNAWQRLLARLYARFLDRITNRSLHLPGGDFDACYWLTLECSGIVDDGELHDIGMAMSFLAPYYVIYSTRKIDPNGSVPTHTRPLHSFDLYEDEKMDAQIMLDEMHALFPDHEPMPAEVGNIIVPDVTACDRWPGTTTLYHCFFTDGWQK